jgi:hypothetical protein
MKRLSIVLLLTAFGLCSCSSANRRHLGTWNSAGSDDKTTVTFAEKTITVLNSDGTSTGRYSIDYGKKPIWLDAVTDANKTHNKCIIEFIGKEAFQIACTEGDTRPSDFTTAGDVMLFRKQTAKD